MKANKSLKALTTIFFVVMIGCYVAYNAGFFQKHADTYSNGGSLFANTLQLNHAIQHVDTPPGNTNTIDTSDKEFWIMAGSKTMFPVGEISDIMLDTNTSDIEKEVQIQQQINASQQSDSLR